MLSPDAEISQNTDDKKTGSHKYHFLSGQVTPCFIIIIASVTLTNLKNTS